MSMANNIGKSFTTFTHTLESLHLENKSRSPEDEMVTWLQYPLEYSVERGYCSELFGSLSSSFGNAKRDQVRPSLQEDGEKRAASAGPENAEDIALALGAERVSGFVFSEGAKVFDKVRTIMQQTGSLQSGSPRKKGSSTVDAAAISSPFQPHRHDKRESYSYHDTLRSDALANTALMAESYAAAYGASHNSSCSRLLRSSVSDHVGANQAMQAEVEPRNLEAAGSSHLVNLQGLRNSGSDVQGSSYSLVSEDHMQKSSFFHAASCAAAGDQGPVKIASLSRGRHTQEANIDAEVVVPSCSGGSQTSGDMSAKETSSMEKQKPEDYEYPSKNTEGDSAEIRQLNKRRSKRSRVAESHNLSEKRRRNRINERLKTLQELIPNSCKTDKASILDEAIEYLKALQSQLQMMSTRNGMRLPPVIMPAGVQHLQGVHMAPFHHPVGIGLPLAVNGSMGMGLGLTQAGIDGTPYQAFPTPHFNLTTSAMPVASRFGSQPYPGMELSSSDFLALQHASAQESYRHSQGISNTEVSQHGEILSTRGVSKDG